jgi:hypothetical protein
MSHIYMLLQCLICLCIGYLSYWFNRADLVERIWAVYLRLFEGRGREIRHGEFDDATAEEGVNK